MWDLSSPTRDRICICCIARWIPNHCTAREAPVLCFEYVWVHEPGGGNDDPLQQWCLGNPMDRGAWQAIESGVSKSWTWLKWLSTHRCVHMCVCVSMQVCGELSISVYVCECVFFNVCVCCVSICVFAHMCLYALCVLLCVFVSMCVCARYYFWCDLLLMNGIRQIWQDTISKFNLPRLWLQPCSHPLCPSQFLLWWNKLSQTRDPHGKELRPQPVKNQILPTTMWMSLEEGPSPVKPWDDQSPRNTCVAACETLKQGHK